MFRRDTKSNLLNAVGGTEWMYRRGALERGRQVSVNAVVFACTIWPKILMGRCFGRLLKICHSVEFTLAVQPVLAIMIFITKWLMEHTGNLPGPCASCGSVRTKLMIKCN